MGDATAQKTRAECPCVHPLLMDLFSFQESNIRIRGWGLLVLVTRGQF